MQYNAVNYCQNKNNYLIKNFVILFYVTLYVNYKEIDKGFNILAKNKNLTLLQQFLNLIMFSHVRSKKIKGKQLLNYITNSTLKRFTPLSCDRDKSVHAYYCTQSFTISRAKILRKMKKNPFPFNWMAKKQLIFSKTFRVGDIDFPWQLEATKWWIKIFKKEKIIVFGGSGFIGSHVAEALNEKGYRVVIADLKKKILIKI